MKNLEILSKRAVKDWPSWHLVYEWEDEISQTLNIPIVNSSKREIVLENSFVRKLMTLKVPKQISLFLNTFFESDLKKIAFEMQVKGNFSYTNDINSIPIIIDFWNNKKSANFFETYKKCKLVCISSLEVYNFLKQKNGPLNIVHLPLSLPDKYKIDSNSTFKKKYDIILAGRKNMILWDFLMTYEKKFPNIEYIYQENVNGKLHYKSNKKGIIGEFHTRDEYINLLKECKIGFYSTPGIDGGEKRTGGFNPVTPRYLEMIASGCQILGRYPLTDETRFYEMDTFCPNIDTYEQFEKTLFGYINGSGPNIEAYVNFLNKHYTSIGAHKLKQYINKTFEQKELI